MGGTDTWVSSETWGSTKKADDSDSDPSQPGASHSGPENNTFNKHVPHVTLKRYKVGDLLHEVSDLI